MDNIKKQRIYIDTSVIGGYYDKEFSEASQLLFEKFKSGEWILVHSEVTDQELFEAPLRVRKLIQDIPDSHIEHIKISEEATRLADRYIFENVVGESSSADCLHIALATINKVDILASWNFKHIVNINRIRGYNGVNLMLGYPPIEIRSPLEILGYEK